MKIQIMDRAKKKKKFVAGLVTERLIIDGSLIKLYTSPRIACNSGHFLL